MAQMRASRGFIIINVLLLGLLLSAPLWASGGQLRSMIELMTLLALAQMWNLLAGYAGLVSIGQQAWIGVGAYTLIVVADDLRLPIVVGIVAGGLVAALLALPAAALLFRLRGGYLSIGTWVIAEVFRLLISSNTEWLRGGSGRTLAAASSLGSSRIALTYWLAVLVGLGATALVYGLMRSRPGLALTAIRDSEVAAASLGVSTQRLKLFVYLLCAFGTGMIGAVIYLNLLRVTPDAAFSVQWTAFMIFIVVIGGIGTIEGPIIGALIFFLLREQLANFGEWSLILLGLVAVGMMLFAPEGLWGLIQRRFHIEIFPVRRRLDLPAAPPEA
jgi:branched-chain amino acid transport system permease protein